jgi:outer membrane protein TolC
MHNFRLVLGFLLSSCGLFVATALRAADIAMPATNATAWPSQPLSLADALDIALQQNSGVLKAKSDLEATHGIVIQTRAIALPKLRGTSQFTQYDPNAVEVFPPVVITGPSPFPNVDGNQKWSAGVQLVQSLYEGGRINASLRTARLTEAQAMLNYQTVVADTLLRTRTFYYAVLLAADLINVREASVNLLTRELEDTTRRFDAGTVPKFNVLRAEVAVANAKPPLISAKNSYRIAKNYLADQLGYRVPADAWEDIPLQLSGTLDTAPFTIDLPDALRQALERRPELASARKGLALREESVKSAKAGYFPRLEAFAGYGSRNSNFSDDLDDDVTGWNVGAQMSWDIFDGRLTKGKVVTAQANRQKAQVELDELVRQVELEVRTAYSRFVEGREVLASQEKVQEQAAEALRLAKSRYDAGSGTQLDVLDAETSLTEARSNKVQAQHDYNVALARLERALGLSHTEPRKP